MKLRATEIEELLRREMNRYERAADVPEYRRLHAEFKCVNPVQCLIALAVANSQIRRIISSSPMTQSVGQLEALVESGSNDARYACSLLQS